MVQMYLISVALAEGVNAPLIYTVPPSPTATPSSAPGDLESGRLAVRSVCRKACTWFTDIED